MRLSEDVVIYFKRMADEAGVPYQSLINLYLRDCLANDEANTRRVQKRELIWRKRGAKSIEMWRCSKMP